jgi:hypothetical protein
MWDMTIAFSGLESDDGYDGVNMYLLNADIFYTQSLFIRGRGGHLLEIHLLEKK